MKKKITITALITVLALLIFTVSALAARPTKVEVCHVTDFSTLDATNPVSMVVGHWISVPEHAFTQDHQLHGDFLDKQIFVDEVNVNDIDYGPVIYGLTWGEIADNLGLDTTDVNCGGFVLDF